MFPYTELLIINNYVRKIINRAMCVPHVYTVHFSRRLTTRRHRCASRDTDIILCVVLSVTMTWSLVPKLD